MAMIEVGYHYTEMYFGATEGNWDYALYTGEKARLGHVQRLRAPGCGGEEDRLEADGAGLEQGVTQTPMRFRRPN